MQPRMRLLQTEATDDVSEESTKDTVETAATNLQKVVAEERKALQLWLADLLGEQSRVLHEHGHCLQQLLEQQQRPPSPRTTASRRPSRRIHSLNSLDRIPSSDVLDKRIDQPPQLSSSSQGSMVLDLRRSRQSSKAGVGETAAVAGPSDASSGGCGSGEWRAIAPVAPVLPRPLPGSVAPPLFPKDSECDALECKAEEEVQHCTQDRTSSKIPTSASLVVSDGGSSDDQSDQDRAEWKKHLQMRVTEQLGGKLRRSGTGTTATPTGVPSRCSCASPYCSRLESVRRGLKKLVECTVFQWICAGVIMLNVAFIGYATNQGMANALAYPPEADPEWFDTMNTVFTLWYVMEWFLRIFIYGREFFTNQDRKWNMFDSILVLFSIVEEVVQDVDVGIGALRVIRGLRMFRVLRIIRVVRYFRDLRLMVCSILQSLGSLSWALLLLVTIMYLFSVVFMQGATLHLLTQVEMGLHSSGPVRDGVQMWYSTVFETMYTLLASTVNGVEWVDVVRPLEHISVAYRLLFSFYIVFITIGVLNVLTGIFVERACELSGLDKDLVIQTQMKRNEAFTVEMKHIFEEADADGSGSISWGEFKEYLENDRVKAYLSMQQLDAFDARTLFDILTEGEEDLTIESFIVGCQRLKGIAKSVDLVAVLQETRAVNKKMKAMMRHLESNASWGTPLAFRHSSTSRIFTGTDTQ